MTKPTQFNHDVSLSGRLLGALLYYPPNDSMLSSLITTLKSDEWLNDWPYLDTHVTEAATLILQGLTQANGETITEAYQRLFIGPNILPAPPWGSVYLDRESVIFGDSTLALRQFQRDNHIDLQLSQREPEDHIGLLLMLSAWIAEQQPSLLSPLLAQHLLPWSSRYLTLLTSNANHPFYQGVALLAQSTLQHWLQHLSEPILHKQLYR